MKHTSLMILLMLIVMGRSFSQTAFPPPDKSPMDISYYPPNYPILKIQDKANEPLVARVIYSRPQKNDRVVFGELVEYGQVWRLGANEASEIELYKDVVIKNNKLKKGRYTLYAIPSENEWTIIFNRETDTWGAFKYDESKDVLRINVVPAVMEGPAESFTMMFDKLEGGAALVIAWDNIKVSLPINF